MYWKKYYKIEQVTEMYFTETNPPPPSEIFFMIYPVDSESNEPAWPVGYRTERHAERGAKRLYQKMIGNFEDAMLGSKDGKD